MMTSNKLPSAYKPQLLSQIRNPLLSRLVNFEEMDKTIPTQGRHINASFTRDRKLVSDFLSDPLRVAKHVSDETKQLALDSGIIVVYQAFNRGIVKYAAENQKFLGAPGYNPERMTWCKTSFQWMMFRCEWATRDINQERVVAITLPIAAFDEILKVAVESTHAAGAGGGSDNDNEKEEKQPKQQQQRKQKKNGNTAAATNDDDGNQQTQEEKEKQEKELAHKEAVRQQHEAERRARNPPCPAALIPCSRNQPVRMQFDPDHTPLGGKRQRRAIQLGLKGYILENFHKWILCIDDITESLVAPGRPLIFDGNKNWMEGYHQQQEEKEEKEDKTEKQKREDPVIFQPLEELYVPLDSKISHYIGLTILNGQEEEKEEKKQNNNGNDDE